MNPRRSQPNALPDNALVRTVAAASRKLTKDLPLTHLQAIDRLRTLHKKFESQWYGTPWLLLEDRFVLPASVPIAQMLEEIPQHGEPIGICGVAQVTPRQDVILVMPFRKDERSRKALEASAQAAKALVDKANEQVEQMRKELAGKGLEGLFAGEIGKEKDN